MPPRLCYDVEIQYTGEEEINTVIDIVDTIDTIHRSSRVYGKPQPNNLNTAKQQEAKPKKQFNIKPNNKTTKELKKQTWFPCGGDRYMARNCPSQNDKGKGKTNVKKGETSKLVEQLSEYKEVYCNTLEFKTYVAAKVKATSLSTIKAHHALEGNMFINGKKARVVFDTGTIGANLISATFVTTHGIPCTAMKEPTKILIAMKGTPSESHKEWTVDP